MPNGRLSCCTNVNMSEISNSIYRPRSDAVTLERVMRMQNVLPMYNSERAVYKKSPIRFVTLTAFENPSWNLYTALCFLRGG